MDIFELLDVQLHFTTNLIFLSIEFVLYYFPCLFISKFPLDKDSKKDYNISCSHGQLYGDVAQLGEHQVRNLGVEGSIPFVSTIYER